MDTDRPVVGIDGCRGGWVCCTLWMDDRFEFDLVGDTRDLIPLIDRCAIACIDMPVGIPSSGERNVDRIAKRILGRYHARVFMTPTRHVLAQQSYENANRVSRETLGKGLSKQSWNLFPKVRDLDALIRDRTELRDRVEECHPELALWGFSQRVVESSKSTSDGFHERMGILRSMISDPDVMFEDARTQLTRKDAKDNDIVDAMICAATGIGLNTQCLYYLDEGLPVDMHNIRMNMIYHMP